MNRIAIIFILFTLPVYAVTPQKHVEITGKVIDNSGLPVAYATVALLQNGEYVTGGVCDSLGVFRLEACCGDYGLHISHIAYKPYKQAVKVPETAFDVGKIRLEDDADKLKGVVVTASAVSREADRFIVKVSGITSMAGKDGTEILSQAPGVWLDDSGISINGMKGSKVYINDREIKLSGEELVSYLRSLNSGDISRIEVIPQAGAEYSADSKGGVVKIMLEKRMNNGLNGSLRMAASEGSLLEYYAPSANVFSRAGRWNINAALSGNFTTRGKEKYDGIREYSGEDTRFRSFSEMNTERTYGTGRLEAIFEINKRHSVGAVAEYSGNNYDTPSDARTCIIQNGREFNTSSNYLQSNKSENTSFTFNYIWNIDTLGSALKFIADYTRQKNNGDNLYNTLFQWEDMRRDSVSRSFTSSDYEILTAELLLDKMLSKIFKLKSGFKYSRNNMFSGALFEGKSGGNWLPYKDYSYDMSYNEDIGAGYISLSANIGRWGLSAGVRGEYTDIRRHDGGVRNSYWKLFPNLSASYAFNDLRTWMLIGQYSRNIERPSFLDINPGRIQVSDYSYQIGNPYLRPTYIHRVSATVVFKYRYTFTAGANMHRDLIRVVCKIDPVDKNVSYIIPENHYTEDHYFIAVSAPFMLSKWCNLTLNFVGVKQDIRFAKEDKLSTHYLMFANSTCGFNLPAGFYAELSYNGNSRLYSGNSEVGGRHVFNASVKKSLLEGRLSLSLALQNFTNRGMEYVARAGNFANILNGHSGFASRYFKLSVSYNFRTGREFKAGKVESSAGAERGRLEVRRDK